VTVLILQEKHQEVSEEECGFMGGRYKTGMPSGRVYSKPHCVLPRGNQLHLFRLYKQGFSLRLAAYEAGVAFNTVRRYFCVFRELHGLVLCECGQISGHRGWCSHRFSKSLRRQEFIKSWIRRPMFHDNGSLGVIWRPDFRMDELEVMRGKRCVMKGCVFGAHQENELCEYHQKIIAQSLALEPGTLEWSDLHDDGDSRSVLAVVLPYQMDNLYETDKFGVIRKKTELEKEADKILELATS
jgi:hypothetical protein